MGSVMYGMGSQPYRYITSVDCELSHNYTPLKIYFKYFFGHFVNSRTPSLFSLANFRIWSGRTFFENSHAKASTTPVCIVLYTGN